MYKDTVEVTFVKCPNSDVCSLRVYAKNLEDFKVMESDIGSIGWNLGEFLPPSDFKDSEGFYQRAYSKKGTAIFNGWTEEERIKNMREIRRKLRKQRFFKIPTHTLTLADLL